MDKSKEEINLEEIRSKMVFITQHWVTKYKDNLKMSNVMNTFDVIGKVLIEVVMDTLEDKKDNPKMNTVLESFNYFQQTDDTKVYNILARLYMDIQPDFYLKTASNSLFNYYSLFYRNFYDLKDLKEAKKLEKIQEKLFAVIENVMDILVSRIEQKQFNTRSNAIESLLAIMKYQDEYTKDHTIRVGYYADLLAKKIFNAETSMDFKIGSQLHDIGKIGVPQFILQSPNRLSQEEFKIIQRHPLIGGEILSNLEISGIMIDVTKYHHERWDGKGYPHQLEKEDIPLTARIIGIIDAFDAMTTTRPYKKAFTAEEALEEVKINREKQFDPEITDIFLSLPFESINLK